MTDNPESGPLNEWLFDEYIRVKDALADLSIRHEQIVNHLADVCRRNDRMQEAGNRMLDTLAQLNGQSDELDAQIDALIQKWTEANV